MQDLIQTPFVQNLLNKVAYVASAIASFLGLVGVQNLAVYIGIFFAAATYIGNRLAVNARRKEELERHKWDREFHLERQRRLQSGESLHWVEPLSDSHAPLKGGHFGKHDA